jgi:hypothetical protein
MGLPSTIGGISGFILAILFIIGMSATDIFPDESQKLKTSELDFANALNITTSPGDPSNIGFFERLLGVIGVDGIYDFIRNFLSMLVAFIVMSVQALFLFIGIATILPTEFYLFFALITSATITAIIKLVFFSGE